uniref:Uncharacterized protein n=1 Tax=Caenorhabditis japonica TaxID=281687 RepID=A0A8R1HUL3_CAEJA
MSSSIKAFFSKNRRRSKREDCYKVDEFEDEREQKEDDTEETRPLIVYTFLGIARRRDSPAQIAHAAMWLQEITWHVFQPEDISPLHAECVCTMPDDESFYFTFQLNPTVTDEKKEAVEALFEGKNQEQNNYQVCDRKKLEMLNRLGREMMFMRSERPIDGEDVVKIAVVQKLKENLMEEKYRRPGYRIQDVSYIEFNVWKVEEEERELVDNVTFEKFYLMDNEAYNAICKEFKNPDYQAHKDGIDKAMIDCMLPK